MKKNFLFFVFVVLITFLFADEYNWEDGQYEKGLNVINSSNKGITLTYSMNSLVLNDAVIKGRAVKEIVFDEQFIPNNPGFPDLPNLSRMIAVPQQAEVKASFSWLSEEIISDIDLAPAFRIPKETEDGLEYFWGKIYEKDEMYPLATGEISELDKFRGVDYVLASIYPFRYNPQKRELHVYRDIKMELEFSGGNGEFGESRLRSRWWDPVLRGNLLNYDQLPEIDYSLRSSLSRYPDYEYLIISPTGQDFLTWADSIKAFRQQQGIRTGVVSLAETGSSNSQIENYINNAYNNWDIPPVAVLLLGDFGTSSSTTVNCPTYDNYCVSDNIFADVTGNNLPDLSAARITARNASELENMIEKFLDYERNPPEDQSFYQNPVVAGGWQTERWFILCTEVVRGFFANVLDKNPIREYAIYDGTPGNSWSSATNTSTVVNYFGSSGLGYLPASPSVIPSWNGNATSINNDINNGCFILQHRDHGGETGWGEPDYDNNNLNGLNNNDLTFVFSTNCLTGKFNWSSECFAEAFHRHAQGALGIVAASEVSYSFVNDAYVWGTYDYMWPEFDPGHGGEGQTNVMPCFANASGKWYLQASNWPYNTDNKEVTYYLFHHHGDAFSTVYTEMPQVLAITYPEAVLSGMTSVEITAESGSYVCLSVNGEILAAVDATGGAQNISIPSQEPLTEIHITATKQDHYRVDGDILVIPPEGAYAVVNNVTVTTDDDEVIEYNETVSLEIDIQNFGNEAADNITVNLSSEDNYINIIDAVETTGIVNAGEIISLADAFSFSVSSSIPNEHLITLTAEVTSDQGSWESQITLTGYAPIMSLAGYSVSGDSNNNGRLDPGEVGNLNIEISNEGGAELYNAASLLDESDQYAEILQSAGEISEIEAGSSGVFTYRIQVSNQAPVGHVLSFDYQCNADYDFALQAVLSLTVGLCLEDFESAGFAEYDWEMYGTGGWQIDTDSYEGSYSAQSVDISNSQTAGMQVELNVLSADEISFYYKVSSESGWDYLSFLVDGNVVEQWSGTINWSEYSYAVSSGTHTFGWQYSKDSSVSSGSDCGWIDYIVFPPVNVPQPAQLLLDNEEFTFAIDPQGSASENLTISNTGGRDLEWSMSKNYLISRESGGPDDYGYQWLDSNEPNGPEYNWIDISTTGTEISFSNNDQAQGNYPIGFEFNFYGTVYDQFLVNPNGWIGFGSDNDEWTNSSIPDYSAPRPAIMGFWDDLYPEIGSNGEGEVYYQNFGDHLVVMFDNVQHYPGSYNGNYTFEMILYQDGNMLLQYQALSGDIDSATIGIQNHNASDALQICYNDDYLSSGLAISIIKVEDWLEVSNSSGTLVMGESASISLEVEAGDLEIGEYLCNLVISCNDPQQNMVTIPVNLIIGGDIIYGDIDDNGAVEAFDAALVLQYVVGMNPPGAPLPWEYWQILRADVDDNNAVEAFDASLIQQYAVGIINTFPAEIDRSAARKELPQKINANSSLD